MLRDSLSRPLLASFRDLHLYLHLHLQLTFIFTSVSSAAQTYCNLLDEYLELALSLDSMVPTLVTALCDRIQTLRTTLMNSYTDHDDDTKTDTCDEHSYYEGLDMSADALHLPSLALGALYKVRREKAVAINFSQRLSPVRFIVMVLSFPSTFVTSLALSPLRYCLFMWVSVAIHVPFPVHNIVQCAHIVRVMQVEHVLHSHVAIVYEHPRPVTCPLAAHYVALSVAVCRDLHAAPTTHHRSSIINRGFRSHHTCASS